MIIQDQLLKNFKILDSEQRLHNIPVPIVAITGGIASGKSTIVNHLKQKDFGVISADELIKEIYQQAEVLAYVRETKPQAFKNTGELDFTILRTVTFNDESFKAALERLLYSKLPVAFWSAYRKLTPANYFFYEVPLLFEKKLQSKVDIIVLLYTDKHIQLKRLSNRDSSSIEVNQKIINSQMPFEHKKDLAHFIIENNTDNTSLLTQANELIKKLTTLLKP